jgi:hypothetical protein
MAATQAVQTITLRPLLDYSGTIASPGVVSKAATHALLVANLHSAAIHNLVVTSSGQDCGAFHWNRQD